jgi:hypothetical protein
MADHIVAMAKVPGFRDYARQRMRELVSQEQGLFVNLPALVQEKLKENEK